MNELSESCFYDLCDDCTWGGCTCRCHEDQEWDWLDGWVDVDEERP